MQKNTPFEADTSIYFAFMLGNPTWNFLLFFIKINWSKTIEMNVQHFIYTDLDGIVFFINDTECYMKK